MRVSKLERMAIKDEVKGHTRGDALTYHALRYLSRLVQVLLELWKVAVSAATQRTPGVDIAYKLNFCGLVIHASIGI